MKTIRYYSDIGLLPESGRSRGGHRRATRSATSRRSTPASRTPAHSPPRPWPPGARPDAPRPSATSYAPTPASAATTTPRRSVRTSAPGSATRRTTARSRCVTGGTPSLSPAKPRLSPPPPARDTSPLPWPPCTSKSPASPWPRSTGATTTTPQSAQPKMPESPAPLHSRRPLRVTMPPPQLENSRLPITRGCQFDPPTTISGRAWSSSTRAALGWVVRASGSWSSGRRSCLRTTMSGDPERRP
ncbi:MerR family DNA-binding transcriptional regulator [Streptomyces sp. I8-5]|uniref:MerR family DNA-binding transcriptional regulator n=1 Tax=Streptomyces sp. I8-5 TaxID=3104277 RepID=UPI00386EB051